MFDFHEIAPGLYTLYRGGLRVSFLPLTREELGEAILALPLSEAECFDLDTEPEYYTGKVVCVKARFPDMWTPGKVYTVKNGRVEDNRGYGRSLIISPAQLSSITHPDNEFIEYKGGA